MEPKKCGRPRKPKAEKAEIVSFRAIGGMMRFFDRKAKLMGLSRGARLRDLIYMDCVTMGEQDG